MPDKPKLKRFMRLNFSRDGSLIFYADQSSYDKTRYRVEPSENVAIIERLVRDLYETATPIGPGVWRSKRKEA